MAKKLWLKAGDRVKVHMYAFGYEVLHHAIDVVFTVRKVNGVLGIDWNAENAPSDGGAFCAFSAFAPSVAFEDVDTKERYHFNQITGRIEPWPGIPT